MQKQMHKGYLRANWWWLAVNKMLLKIRRQSEWSHIATRSSTDSNDDKEKSHGFIDILFSVRSEAE